MEGGTVLLDVPLAELATDELHARSAWAQVYLVRAGEPESAIGDPPESVLQDHVDYLSRLESSGRLYAYGHVEVLAGDSVRELAIIVAASMEEAVQIAANDPLHRAGHRTNTVQGHIINEGVACYVAREMSRRALVAAESSPAVERPHVGKKRRTATGPAVELYLILLESTDKPRPVDDTDADHSHFVWLRENEMAARLLSCGPVEPAEPLGAGIWPGGLGVVATSRKEAEHLARNEPSGRAGYRTLSVRGWTIHRGVAAPIARALHALNALPISSDDPIHRVGSRGTAGATPTLAKLGLGIRSPVSD